ncbi:MAG: hypothetical protein SOR77_09510 [Peptoniphilus sp.]|nr:hypothetical protein [Peptoniphilus sp.]MDY2987856.1 hypothetical protein [Peptoniphilus sp.]
MSNKFVIDIHNVFMLLNNILQNDLKTDLGDSVNFSKRAIVVTKNI